MRLAGDQPSEVFRLESPSSVFHYRGEPHLHALFNVAMDGEHPLSLGEDLGVNSTPIEGADVARLFEGVMREQEGADCAFYPRELIASRLRAGRIRSGDIYSLESWRSFVHQVEIRGADISGELASNLARAGEKLQPTSLYRIATTDWVADHPVDYGFDDVVDTYKGRGLRGATIDHIRKNGFNA